MTMSAGSRILWAAPVYEKVITDITELYEVNVVNIVNDVNCEINFVNEKYIEVLGCYGRPRCQGTRSTLAHG